MLADLFLILAIVFLLAQQSSSISYNAELFAGNKVGAFAGDLGPAINASFRDLNDIWMDSVKKLYVSDQNNLRIRVISASKVVSTFAGLY